MPLDLAGQSFRVSKATLGGTLFDKSWRKFDPTIGKGVQYTLIIECESGGVVIDDRPREWKPQLTFERFSIKAKRWPQIESSSCRNVEGAGFLEFHEDAIAASISFEQRTGVSFQTRINGTVANQSYEFAGPVEFVGYRVVGTIRDTEETLTRMLAKQLDLVGLEPEDSVVDESIPVRKMRAKLFQPVE